MAENKVPDSEWIFVGNCFDGDPFQIDGVGVWRTWQETGERAKIRDPLWGQAFTFPVYTMTNGEKTIEFAAGEFSNTVWGFFQRKP